MRKFRQAGGTASSPGGILELGGLATPVCPELVEGPSFFCDRLEEEGRCFDKLSTGGVRAVHKFEVPNPRCCPAR